MAQTLISQDFEEGYKAVDLIRKSQAENTKLIKGALERIGDLKIEGNTYSVMLDIFVAWQENMEIENAKLGQFADKVEGVLVAQLAAEAERSGGLKYDGIPRGTVSGTAPKE